MRLLTKSEITLAKSKDQQQAIKEGLKLTHQVDSLREIRLQEEASLQEYRKKTITQIQDDLKKEAKPLEKLRKEVEKLKEERKELLKPLTEEENRITEARAEMLNEKRILGDREFDLNTREAILERSIKENQNEQHRVNIERDRTKELLSDADSKRSEAQKELSEARKTRQNADNLAQIAIDKINRFNIEKEIYERNFKIKQKEQEEHEKDLNVREVKLRDRIKMFERTLKR